MGMVALYSDRFVLPLPAGHRFPMVKYRLLRERVSAAFPGLILEEPMPAQDAQLHLAHDPAYVARLVRGDLSRQELQRIGFPWTPEMVERSRRSTGATIAAGRYALRDGVSLNLAGGTHHAHTGHGEGFCCFNDAVVAARVLQQEGLVQRVLIVDLDVHQGNGTAEMARGDPNIFTFSMHGATNYPFKKAESDLDIELPDRTTDVDYLAALAQGLTVCERALVPDLLIYLAGADPFEGDRLGRLALTKSGLLQRDEMVFGFAKQRGLPVAVAMAGGYARVIEDTVDIHFQTVSSAIRHWDT
jgi:acetoin utilization deacetylase AcuC-like enzyme